MDFPTPVKLLREISDSYNDGFINNEEKSSLKDMLIDNNLSTVNNILINKKKQYNKLKEDCVDNEYVLVDNNDIINNDNDEKKENSNDENDTSEMFNEMFHLLNDRNEPVTPSLRRRLSQEDQETLKQERLDEIEVLKSMFEDDLDIINDDLIRLCIHPFQAMEMLDYENKISIIPNDYSLWLTIYLPISYPITPPIVELESHGLISTEDENELNKILLDNAKDNDTAMIYDLSLIAQEYLGQKILIKKEKEFISQFNRKEKSIYENWKDANELINSAATFQKFLQDQDEDENIDDNNQYNFNEKSYIIDSMQMQYISKIIDEVYYNKTKRKKKKEKKKSGKNLDYRYFLEGLYKSSSLMPIATAASFAYQLNEPNIYDSFNKIRWHPSYFLGPLSVILKKFNKTNLRIHNIENIMRQDYANMFYNQWIEYKKKYNDNINGSIKIKANKPYITFHGSKMNLLSSIVQNSLRVPPSSNMNWHTTDVGYYGRGLYVSPSPTTASNYAEGNKLIVAATLMGRIKIINNGSYHGANVASGFDSHKYGDEWILFKNSAVLPCYIISYDFEYEPKKIYHEEENGLIKSFRHAGYSLDNKIEEVQEKNSIKNASYYFSKKYKVLSIIQQEDDEEGDIGDVYMRSDADIIIDEGEFSKERKKKPNLEGYI